MDQITPETLNCGGRDGLIIGVIIKEGYMYEKRLQNVLYFAREHELSRDILTDVEFKETVDGPFSEEIRGDTYRLVNEGALKTKTDIQRGIKLLRLLPNVTIECISDDVLRSVERIYTYTKSLDTDSLIQMNLQNIRGDRDHIGGLFNLSRTGLEIDFYANDLEGLAEEFGEVSEIDSLTPDPNH